MKKHYITLHATTPNYTPNLSPLFITRTNKAVRRHNLHESHTIHRYFHLHITGVELVIMKQARNRNIAQRQRERCMQKYILAKHETRTFIYKKGMSIMDYIAQNAIHEIVTRSLVRKIASNTKNRRCVTCLELVKSGFSQEIINDLCNDMFITLANLCEGNNINIDTSNGYGITFDEMPSNEDNKTRTYIVECYKSIDRTFSHFANPKYEYPNTDLIDWDYTQDIDYSDNNHVDTIELCESFTTRKNTSPDYLYKVVDDYNNRDTNNVFESLKEDRTFLKVITACKQELTPKTYDRLEQILLYLFYGSKKQEICDSLGITENQYNFVLGRFRSIYRDLKAQNETNTVYISGLYIRNDKKKTYTYCVRKGKKGDYKPIIGTIYNPTPTHNSRQGAIQAPKITTIINTPVVHNPNKAIINACRQRERLVKLDIALHETRLQCGLVRALNKPKQDILNSKPYKLATTIKNKKIARVKLLSA